MIQEPKKRLSETNDVMTKLYGSNNYSPLSGRIPTMQLRFLETDDCPFEKFPTKKDYYINQPETEEYEYTVVNTDLEPIISKYSNDSVEKVIFREFAKDVWDLALDAALQSLDDYFKVGNRDMVRRYVDKKFQKLKFVNISNSTGQNREEQNEI
jgi:hypothetical protein